MSTYDAVAGLPLEVEGYWPRRAAPATSPAGSRGGRRSSRSTGGDETGVGEDVTYDAGRAGASAARRPGARPRGHVHDRLVLGARRLARPLPGRRRRASTAGATTGAGPSRARRSISRSGRPARSLADALGRRSAPGHASSSRCGSASRRRSSACSTCSRRIRGRRFKLDPTSDWDEALVERARRPRRGRRPSTSRAPTAARSSTSRPTPALYRLVAEGFPEAWIEDPDLSSPEADAVLEPHRDRITWDAIIHSVADVEALPVRPARAEREAVPVRQPARAPRHVRLLPRALDRGVRGRPVRARPGAWADPVPGLAVQRRRAERRRAGGLQRPGAGAGTARRARSRPGCPRRGFRWDADGLPARPRGHSV